MTSLATWCDEKKQPEEAAQTRAWIMPGDPRQIVIYEWPVVTGWPTIEEGVSPLRREWREQFQSLRAAYADKLFQLARAAVKAKRTGLAWELAGETLHQYPDHEAARRVWGFQRVGDEWRTPFEAAKLKAGQAWHAKYGWLPKGHAERYDAGERVHQGRWIPAEQDARVHSQIDTGWEVDGEHFTVTTNQSLEAAVQMSVKLERLHRAWQQLFAGYAATNAELVRLFDGGPRPARPNKRKQVVFFRNEEEYRRALAGEIPEGVETAGIYLSDRRTAYFFASEQPDDGTLFHEAVHQLFSESRPVSPAIGRDANFWLIEGIACYFESLSLAKDRATLGGIGAVRAQDARFRRLKDDFYVPLATWCGMGKLNAQRDERIAKLYSQSAGLTDFLMHGEGGKHREGLAACLLAIYTGRDRQSTLAESLGAALPQLDEQYADFLRTTDDDLLAANLPADLDRLLLAGTRVTDRGLQALERLPQLRTLDLAKTAVTDAGLARIEGLTKLESLDLTGTQVTPAAVARLQKLRPQLKIAC